MKKNILFLTLKVFSTTGGIEKICRIIGKALWEGKQLSGNFSIFSMYDKAGQLDSKYFPPYIYKAFNAQKLSFGFESIKSGTQSDIVILSHSNLLIFGYLIKLLKPSVKLVLFAHGIEVWQKFSRMKIKWLDKCDKIICVSNFTKQKMVFLQQVNQNKCVILNNCLDPFLPPPQKNKNKLLLQQYELSEDNIVLLTLSRLSAHDRNKGYKNVLESLSILIKKFPQLVYIIAGKYDLPEKQWLDKLIEEKFLKNHVFFSGYIKENEIANYFSLCDLYIMPSTKEGFGIVFIEAMYFGKPVLGGNKDGSVDAFLDGKLGVLVDPGNIEEITDGIKKILLNKEKCIPLKEEVLKHFGYETYKQNLFRHLYYEL